MLFLVVKAYLVSKHYCLDIFLLGKLNYKVVKKLSIFQDNVYKLNVRNYRKQW